MSIISLNFVSEQKKKDGITMVDDEGNFKDVSVLSLALNQIKIGRCHGSGQQPSCSPQLEDVAQPSFGIYHQDAHFAENVDNKFVVERTFSQSRNYVTEIWKNAKPNDISDALSRTKDLYNLYLQVFVTFDVHSTHIYTRV
jgi:hypothetical protein